MCSQVKSMLQLQQLNQKLTSYVATCRTKKENLSLPEVTTLPAVIREGEITKNQNVYSLQSLNRSFALSAFLSQ